MTSNPTVEAVPQELAFAICADLRQENRRKWYRIVPRLWCWGCVTFTGGQAEKMCGGVVSCPQVLARYRDQSSRQKAGGPGGSA